MFDFHTAPTFANFWVTRGGEQPASFTTVSPVEIRNGDVRVSELAIAESGLSAQALAERILHMLESPPVWPNHAESGIKS